MDDFHRLPFDDYHFAKLSSALTSLPQESWDLELFVELTVPKLLQRAKFFGLTDVEAQAWAKRSVELMVTVLPTRSAEVREKGLRYWVLVFTARLMLPASPHDEVPRRVVPDLLALFTIMEKAKQQMSPLQRSLIDKFVRGAANDLKLGEELGLTPKQLTRQRETAEAIFLRTLMAEERTRSLAARLVAPMLAATPGGSGYPGAHHLKVRCEKMM